MEHVAFKKTTLLCRIACILYVLRRKMHLTRPNLSKYGGKKLNESRRKCTRYYSPIFVLVCAG